MATKLYFSRDTKVIAHVPMAAAATKNMYYDIPVLDGFSFSQATNTSEITLNEAQSTSGVSRRGRAMFNDSFAPVEWSFSTYMMPFTSAGGVKGTSGKACCSATSLLPTSITISPCSESQSAAWASIAAVRSKPSTPDTRANLGSWENSKGMSS